MRSPKRYTRFGSGRLGNEPYVERSILWRLTPMIWAMVLLVALLFVACPGGGNGGGY
jgi:hypothetical protein